MTIPGLSYIENVIPENFEREIIKYFNSSDFLSYLFPVTNNAGISTQNSRMVAHFGYAYNYGSGSTQQEAPAMPSIISRIRDLVLKLNLVPEYFNQCIINRYLPGQGIGAHID